MATISENLQTIKSSTDAIKQAIIDKGGTISGDITTWASAISEIETGGGSSSDEEYVFTGTISYNMTKVTITGRLNKNPDTGRNFLLVLGLHPVLPSMLYYASHYIGSTDSYTLTVDFEDTDGPLTNEIPAICILNIMGNTHTIIPVRFSQQFGGSDD